MITQMDGTDGLLGMAAIERLDLLFERQCRPLTPCPLLKVRESSGSRAQDAKNNIDDKLRRDIGACKDEDVTTNDLLSASTTA